MSLDLELTSGWSRQHERISFVFWDLVLKGLSALPSLSIGQNNSGSPTEIVQMWHKQLLGAKDELIRFWW